MRNINILVGFNDKEKKDVDKYSTKLGLGYAGFIRSATLEKIERMKLKEDS